VVVVHHANKGGGEPNMDSIRGSSRMAGEVDLIVVVRKKERGQLEVFLDGRDLVRDDDGGNLAVEYEGDHPHRMRAVGFAVNAQGVEGATRPAVLKVLGRASERLSTSDVRVAVAEQLGETRTRQAVTQELQALADGGTVVKHASGKGKTAYWELDV
jgi:predicted NBD/HSP70 family sugar kinase